MILIVGGAGYIGSHVNKILAGHGYNTVVFDNLARGHRELVKWGKFMQGDLLNKKSIDTVFQENPIDSVMHFAAFAYIGESVADPAGYYLNNVTGTMNLLESMREHGVNKLIFSSTCSIYGSPEKMPITEDQPKNPINPYGQSKLVVENILRDYDTAYGLRYVCLRYFNAAGADPDAEIGEWHEPETHLIPLVIDAAIGIKPHITVFGTDYNTPDGTCIRDYIHVIDLAVAHVLSLEYLLNGGKSNYFNLGNKIGVSVKEVIETVKAVSGLDVPIVYGDRRPGDPAILIGSSEKIMKELGWKPNLGSLEQIVQTAFWWHKKLNSKNQVWLNT